MNRRKPNSTTQKKKQLQQKREQKRDKSQDATFDDWSGEPRPVKKVIVKNSGL